MDCSDLIIIILILILIYLVFPVKYLSKNYSHYLKFVIPSYVRAKSSMFIPDNNNYQYNHIGQEKMNCLRFIKKTNKSIRTYIDKFLKMDYDKYFDDINIYKLNNIEL